MNKLKNELNFYVDKTITVEMYLDCIPFKGQTFQGDLKINRNNVNYIKEHINDVLYHTTQKPVIYSPTKEVLVGNHRYQALKELVLEGKISPKQKFKVQVVNQRQVRSELTKLAVTSNTNHAKENIKTFQVYGDSEVAKQLYIPIIQTIDSLKYKKLSEGAKQQVVLYLASLLNENPSYLYDIKKITPFDLYAQRRTDIGKTVKADYLYVVPKVDLRGKQKELLAILKPGLDAYEFLKKDLSYKKTMGGVKQIIYFLIALGARGWLETDPTKRRSKKITNDTLLRFFTDEKYAYEVGEWKSQINNHPKKQYITMVNMIRKVKRGLPI